VQCVEAVVQPLVQPLEALIHPPEAAFHLGTQGGELGSGFDPQRPEVGADPFESLVDLVV
jgi:hypothetical protein